jgi:hypothetical protein
MMRMCSSGKISAEGHCDIVMLLSPPRGSQHRNRDIGGVTFLKRACNDIALAGDTVLAFCDEPISLG